MVLVALLLLAALALVALSCRRYDTWRRKGVPSPWPVPLFGNLMWTALQREPMYLELHRLYRRFPGRPFVGLYAGPSPVLLVCGADAIKHITIKDFDVFANHKRCPDARFDPTVSRFLFCLPDAEWKVTRAKVTPAFSSGRLKAMFPGVRAVSEQLVRSIRDNVGPDGVLDAADRCSRFGVDVIGSCAFGCDAEALRQQEPSAYMKAVVHTFSLGRAEGLTTFTLMFAPALYRLLGLPVVHEWRAAMLRALLRQTREHREREPTLQRDIFDALLELDRSHALPQADFEAQVMQMQVAGLETSATTASLGLWMLARHPHCQQRLRDELVSAQAAAGGALDYKHLQGLRYLDCVFKETLRLWPVMPVLDRVASRDYAVPGTSLKIDKGTIVLLPIYSIMRDPAIFEDASSFVPERFGPQCSAAAADKLSWLPFGSGPRSCIGSRFAEMSVKLALAHVVLAFRVSLAARTPRSDDALRVNPRAILINLAAGLPLRFEDLATAEDGVASM